MKIRFIRHLLIIGLAGGIHLLSLSGCSEAVNDTTHSAESGEANDAAPIYGPPRGHLIIAGGGNLIGSGIIERFIELAGGPDNGVFLIVPTAGGNFNADGTPRLYDAELVLAPWKTRGLRRVSMLHTHDPLEADSESFAGQLSTATGVWFMGGRQWNIVDSYAGTKTYAAFHSVLARGGVIGGSSAGATIQGEYLVRGDTEGSDIVMTDEPEHERGFEFLARTAIDQHVDTRNRWDDIISVIKAEPHLLGFGLSEATALEVDGDVARVIGNGKVAVHDNSRTYAAGEKPYFLIKPGDVFDMRERKLLTGDQD